LPTFAYLTNASMNLNDIIPPSDHAHRESFTNEPLLDALGASDRRALEQALVATLQAGSTDLLVVETLAYLHAQSAVPAVQAFIARCPDPTTRLGATAALYRLTQDRALLAPALAYFRALEARQDAYRVYGLIAGLYYLAEFEGPEVAHMLETYAHHPEYLLSYNAARARSMPRRFIRPVPEEKRPEQSAENH
jgi:hypothetical protein